MRGEQAEKDGSAHDGSRQRPPGWLKLGAAEKKTISVVAGAVGVASGVSQYLQPYTRSGAELLGISLVISVAGGSLIVVLSRLLANPKRRITVPLLPAAAGLVLSGLIGGGIGHFASHRGTKPNSTAIQPLNCPRLSPEALASGRYEFPEVEGDVARGLKFCAVDLNHGASLASPSFTMYGQVLGHIPRGKELAMVNVFESSSHDRCNPPHWGTGGYFRTNFEYDSSTGAWQVAFNYGYPQADSLAVRFTFVLATRAALQNFRQRMHDQRKSNPAVPGLPSLSPRMYEVATFVTQAKDAGPLVKC